MAVSLERIQKLIARAGVCSRRDAEDWIREGRVTVNGRCAELGDQADLASDSIKVDGKRLRAAQPLRYILLYKPPGMVTTNEDPEGRPTVLDALGGRVGERVFPVGRLDYGSEGLVILTNDGEFALRVAHPRYGVLREYLAKVKGVPDEADRSRLARGTFIEGQRVVPHDLALVRPTASGMNSWWRVVVGEGKTHEVREMFRHIGHPVQRLLRVAIGPVRDPSLKAGVWRELTAEEIEGLRRGGRPVERGEDARTKGAGVHPQAGRLRAGKTDRGGGAGAGGERHRQARVERKPPRPVPEGGGRRQGGAAHPAPVPGRKRARPPQGARRSPRR
ncbi:MAG: rRNA pseudouridine synthase [Acidobacteria bacterium]|nr:MAG: rRNA pseudouridine synthase [Acidobacteriota bacterium]